VVVTCHWHGAVADGIMALVGQGNPWVTAISNIRFLVLDEADRMVEEGHFRELTSLLSALPKFKNAHNANKQQTKKAKRMHDQGEEFRDFCSSMFISRTQH
jgi:superfamily II DNA/RNA helicase